MKILSKCWPYPGMLPNAHPDGLGVNSDTFRSILFLEEKQAPNDFHAKWSI